MCTHKARLFSSAREGGGGVRGASRLVSVANNGACKRLLRYVRSVGSPQRVCVERGGTGSMVGGGGGGPEPCVCVERGGAWGGGRSGVWEFVAPSNYLCVCVCLFFIFFIFGGSNGSPVGYLPYWEEKASIVPPPPPQPTRCGWWGVLGAGMECVGNGGGVLCCGGGGCNAVPVCMCAWLKAALHDLQVSMTPLNVKLGPLAGDRKKGERGQSVDFFTNSHASKRL